MPVNIILFDNITNLWVRFSNPVETIQADFIQQVIPALDEIEKACNNGLYAAGFISYEAASAFDDALTTKESGDFPLLQFGLYEKSEPLNLDKIPMEKYSLRNWKSAINQNNYLHNITKIKKEIAAGQTYQVNYTYRLHAEFSGNPFSFFLTLLSSQKTNYAMYMEWNDYAICSVSPELFFQLNGDKFVCKPMKGTAKRGRYFKEDQIQADNLQFSEKERAENVMIVDMMRNDLGRIAETGTVKVESLFDVERYNTAWQMTSTVAAQTSASITKVFKAMFPCASITGAPKASTMRIISQLENSPRKIYTGTMGLIHPNRKAQFNVAIRTVLIDKKKNRAEYGTGGGIVWDSIPENEFVETKTKSQVLFAGNKSFELLETILWERGSGYFLLDYHLKRMGDSAQYFDFSFPEKSIHSILMEIESLLTKDKYKIRLLLNSAGEIHSQKFEINHRLDKPVQLGLCPIPVNPNNAMLFNKTTDREIYERAKASRPDCDDVLLVNEKGHITETTICNIIVRKHDQLITPALECGLLPGTFRQYLLDNGEIKEGFLTIDDLGTAKEIFVINSVQKWSGAKLV